MFIPSKPEKYGLKLWVMADSDTNYCADAQLYAGKVTSQCDVGQGMQVVLQLTESISGSGRNVTTDNSFTSYQLSKELTKRKLTLVGTIRGNRKEIPVEMLPAVDREVKSSVFGFSTDGATMQKVLFQCCYNTLITRTVSQKLTQSHSSHSTAAAIRLLLGFFSVVLNLALVVLVGVQLYF